MRRQENFAIGDLIGYHLPRKFEKDDLRPRRIAMKIIVTLAVVLAATNSAFAFSAGGHRIIAEIAWQAMDEDSRDLTYRVLQAHPRYEQDFTSKMPANVQSGSDKLKARWLFHQASFWPDTVRGLPESERQKYNRGNWHYVNFPTYLDDSDSGKIDLSTVNRSTDWDGDYDSPQNIIQAFKANLAGYRDEERSDAQRAVHLCWVLHLVGDAHQPLHSTALFTPQLFPAGDRGGNLIQVGRSNLHSVWDRLLPNATTVGEVGSAAQEAIAIESRFSKQWHDDDGPEVWLEESWKLAKYYAYDRTVRAAVRAAEEAGDDQVTVKLPERYFETAGLEAKRRAVQAGNRLAHLLHRPHKIELAANLKDLEWLVGRYKTASIQGEAGIHGIQSYTVPDDGHKWNLKQLTIKPGEGGEKLEVSYRITLRAPNDNLMNRFDVVEEISWDEKEQTTISRFTVKYKNGSKHALAGKGSYTIAQDEKDKSEWLCEGKFVNDHGISSPVGFRIIRSDNGFAAKNYEWGWTNVALEKVD